MKRAKCTMNVKSAKCATELGKKSSNKAKIERKHREFLRLF